MNKKHTIVFGFLAVLVLAMIMGLMTTPMIHTAGAQSQASRGDQPIARLIRDRDDDDDDDEDEDEDEEYEEEWEEYEEFIQHIELYSMMLDMIDDMSKIAESPTSSAVAAIMAAEDYADSRDLADLFETSLEATPDATTKRMLRLKLAELYGEMDEPEKALEQLRVLIMHEE